jgi:hypothetical protein
MGIHSKKSLSALHPTDGWDKYKCESGEKLPKSLFHNQTKVVLVAHPNENKRDKNKCNHNLLSVPDYHLHKDNNDWLSDICRRSGHTRLTRKTRRIGVFLVSLERS